MVRPDEQRKRDGLRCGDSEAQRRLGKRSGRKSGRERSGRKGDNPDRAYGPVAENCTAVFFLICAVVKSDVQQAPSLFFTCTVTDGSASKYSVALSVGGSVKFVVPNFTPILDFPASVLALALSCGERQYKRERPIFRGTVNSRPRKAR